MGKTKGDFIMPDQASPVVDIHLDDDHAGIAGSGHYRLIVLTIGPRWVRLLYPAKARALTVPRAYFDQHAQPVDR